MAHKVPFRQGLFKDGKYIINGKYQIQIQIIYVTSIRFIILHTYLISYPLKDKMDKSILIYQIYRVFQKNEKDLNTYLRNYC